jgi:hypothetical protein
MRRRIMPPVAPFPDMLVSPVLVLLVAVLIQVPRDAATIFVVLR